MDLDDPTIGILVEDLKSSEGYRRFVYWDTSGVETIGYGETSPTIINKFRSSGISEKTAAALLKDRAVNDFLIPALSYIMNVDALNPNQKAALGSLAYNIGMDAQWGFPATTVVKYINQGLADNQIAMAQAFHLWDNPDGVLKNRRQKEIDRFFTPWVGESSEDEEWLVLVDG